MDDIYCLKRIQFLEVEMTLYYVNPRKAQLARKRMWEQMMDERLADDSCKVIIPVDVIANEDDFAISAFVPGVNAEDINIEIVDDTVTLEGEIKVERSEDDNYLMSERPSGKFRRVITLPSDLDADKTEAELSNGVLTIRVAKSELTKPRKIKISNN